MELWFYDIEISINGFMITFIQNVNQKIIDAYVKVDIEHNDVNKGIILDKGIKPVTFIMTENGINDYSLLIDFMSVHKTLIGYNNNNYDNLILDYLCYFYSKYNKDLKHKQTNTTLNWELYDLSQKIIVYGKGYNRVFYNEYHIFKYMKTYTAYDIQKILYLDKSFTSLKQIAVQLKWYRLQNLPYHYDEPWTKDMLPMVRDYNINDVLITMALFNNQINEVKLRNDVSEEYEINLRNQSRSGMANMLASKFYEEKSGLKKDQFIDLRTNRFKVRFNEIISDKVKFKTDTFNKLLTDLKNYVWIQGNQFNKDVLFKDTLYTIATGGLHSNDDPRILISTDNVKLIDADVGSFYPFIILILEVFPEHLDKVAFLELVSDIVYKRIDNKTIAGKLKKLLKVKELTSDERSLLTKTNTVAEALKIVINAIYGENCHIQNGLIAGIS